VGLHREAVDCGVSDFDGDARLWFYVLREAELLAGSRHLGPVGGRIVAAVLIGLLVGDPLSWLNIEPGWRPALVQDGRFGMPELIRFALSGQSTATYSPRTSTVLSEWRANFRWECRKSRIKTWRNFLIIRGG
jgi:hypothetical protein